MNNITHGAPFTIAELCHSVLALQHGIDNTAPRPVQLALRTLNENLLEIQEWIASDLIIESAYRCPALNTLCEGKKNSAHMLGYAADIVAPHFALPPELMAAIYASRIPFDQLILERSWVHISFAPPLRGEALVADNHTRPPSYHPYHG